MKNQGLDFANFKKTAQDKSSAVLTHPDGHSIKIAIAGLNPKMRKKLADLPLHQAEPEAPVEAMDPQSPEPVQDTPADAPIPQQEAQPAAEDTDTNNAAPEAAAPPPVAASPNAPSPVGGQSMGAPAAPATTPDQSIIPPTADQRALARTGEDMKLADDMRTGKITPKTYKDLYDDKSTLGKVGTIFGLALSGIGSGLTKQPNAALAMMDKVIERDLEAQKASQANKQNWYTLSLAHEKQIPENALKSAEAEKMGLSTDMQRWQNAQAGVTNMSSSTRALNSMRAGAIQSFQNSIDLMPPGPAKAQAQQLQDSQVTPFFLNKAHQDNLSMEQKKDAVDAANPLPAVAAAGAGIKANPPPKGIAQAGVKYDAVNQNKLAAAIQKGKFAPGAPDAIPDGLIGPVNQEVKDLTTNRNNLADAKDSFDALTKMGKGAGQVPVGGFISGIGTTLAGLAGSALGPVGAGVAGTLGHSVAGPAGAGLQGLFERNRAIQVEALKSRLGGNMSDDAKNALAESILPSWKDMGDEKSIGEAHRKMLQHFESNPAEAAPNLTRLGLKYPMPKYTYTPAKPAKQATPQSTGTTGDW